MSHQVRQTKEKITSAEAKRHYLGSIHRRIISIPWILMKRFGYTIEICREKRQSKLTFPYYLVSKIISDEGKTLFNSNELSEEFQKKIKCSNKKQTETNYIKKMLNNKLVDILKSLGFLVKTKTTNQISSEKLKEIDNNTTLKINCICYENKKYDMESVEKIIGDEAKESLKNFFKKNSRVKLATFYLNKGNVIECKFTRNNKDVVWLTDINPFDQLSTIESSTINKKLFLLNESSQLTSCINNTNKTVKKEQYGIENNKQINSVNTMDEVCKSTQTFYGNEMFQQPSNDILSHSPGIVTISSQTPLSYNQNTSNNCFLPELDECERQRISYNDEICFSDGLMQLHIYQQIHSSQYQLF
ncbi:hypothetical protein QTN25_010624 [Entamoeba marina]